MTLAFDANMDLTVEMGFGDGPLEATIAWTDVTAYVRAGSWDRGRGSLDSDFPAGSGELVLDNTTGRFYPWNTSGPYTPNVVPGVPVRITGDAASAHVVFFGFVQSWSNAYPVGREELVTVPIVERVGRLQSKNVTHTSSSIQRTDLRIDDLLDDAGWPAAARDLDNGAGFVAPAIVEGSVLDAIRNVMEAEQGIFFQAGNGDLVMRHRNYLSTATPTLLFGPEADGTYINPYADLSIPTNDDQFLNEARITGLTGGEQVAQDSASITTRGPVGYQTTNELLPDASAALNVAEVIVNRRKSLITNIELVTDPTMNPTGAPTHQWDTLLAAELGDLIGLKATYPGSAVTFQQDTVVEGINHSFQAAGDWTTTFRLRVVTTDEQGDYWILGTSALNSTAILA